TLNHLMFMSYTDVAQVANAARNYEILHERDDEVLSNPGVLLRVTPIQFALLVNVDTKESVVELQVLVSSVVKLAIYRKITRRTPLRAHL
nr:hypothetical protein [Tanacetum cinerariifolium]